MKVVFLDRDGTINADTDFVFKKEDLAWEKNVLAGLRLLAKNGFKFIILTNQSGIARGYFSEKDFFEFNNFLVSELKKEDIIIKKTYFCPYHPTKGVGKYLLDSPLRKPGTGMIEKAFEDFKIEKKSSWMIGDKWADILAGNNFGLRSVLVKTGKSGADKENETKADFLADDFLEAAKFIIKNDEQ